MIRNLKHNRRSGASIVVMAIMVAAAGTTIAGETTLGLGVGATAGLGVQADVTFSQFTRNSPLSLRFSTAYSTRDAGSALDTRRVFINDNTNGTPTESADTWQLRLDLLIPVAKLGQSPVNLGAGVRKTWFTATFDFVGGNEKYDIVSDPWGVGVYLDTSLEMSDRWSFLIQVGVDYFFKSRIEGHDTAYEPDGDDVNPRNDYTWDDANDSVNQPYEFEPFGLIGLRLGFGS